MHAQEISPMVIGSAGGTGTTGTVQIYYQIGEPIVATGNSGSNSFTQGFVQPTYDTAYSVLTILVNSSNESCLDANDGSISLSAFGVKGNLSIVWTHVTQDTNLLNNLSPGTYSFTAIDSLSNGSAILYNNGTPIVISITEENSPCPVDPVNSFSPNFDDTNESFAINGIENYPKNSVKIFSRWGMLIWETENYSNTNFWDGRDKNGNQILAGTYFYIIEIDSLKLIKGWVEIIK